MLIRASDTAETEGPKENDRLFQLIKSLRIHQKSTESVDFLFSFCNGFCWIMLQADTRFSLSSSNRDISVSISYEINAVSLTVCMCQVRRLKG